MSSTGKTLFERTGVPIEYLYTFLDLPDIVKSSAACKKAQKIASSRIVWKELAPSFGLPSCRWPLHSFEEGKANLLLLKRVCSLYPKLSQEGLKGVRSQFRTQVKPAELRLDYEEIYKRFYDFICQDTSKSLAYTELMAVTRDPLDPEIFEQMIQSLSRIRE